MSHMDIPVAYHYYARILSLYAYPIRHYGHAVNAFIVYLYYAHISCLYACPCKKFS